MTAQKKKIVEVDVGDEVVELTSVPDEPEVEETPADDTLDMVTVTFRGQNFEIPKLMDEWETEACLAMNEGNYVAAAKMLLGRAQWPLLMALGNKRKDIREFLAVFADVVDKECVA